MAAHGIPVLYPANVGEFVSYGLLGYAMSRYSGCWVGFKVVNETAEQTATVDIDLDTMVFEQPDKGEQLMALQSRPLAARLPVAASCHNLEQLKHAQALGLDLS